MNRILMPVIKEVARKNHVHPAYVFKCAFDYFEELHNVPREIVLQLWKKAEKDDYFNQYVEDFCLDVLNGTAKLPIQWKTKGGVK